MTSFARVAAAALLAGAAGAQVWRVVPAEPAAAPGVPLPPLARASALSAGGERWRQTGEVGGALPAARGEVLRALGAAGWALNKTIVMGREPARSELMVWSSGRRRILFMVWEKETGTCGFAWGEER